MPWIPCLAEQRAQDGNGGKKDHEDDGDIEDQPLYAAPRLEDRAGAIAAKCASQPGPTHLEQDKEDDDDAQYNLDNTNCWKPLCSQSFPPLFYLIWRDHRLPLNQGGACPALVSAGHLLAR